MPVILEAKDFEQWERGGIKDAAALMKPAAEDVLQKWPVSKRVRGRAMMIRCLLRGWMA
jgi:putative SOS response-associated peptidase YedK